MADKLTLDVGLAVDLKAGFARNGWTEAQIKRASRGDFLKGVLDVLEGRAEIRHIVSSTIVDLDVDPFVPEGWTVVEHRKGGMTDLAKGKIGLYLVEAQRRGGFIGGYDLRKWLADKPVLNANALDFYLENPRLIPEDWKGKFVYFWGTVYRDGDGNLCVRCLCWSGDGWSWDCSWLAYRWLSDGPAAVRASSA